MTAYERVTARLREVTGFEPRGGKGDWRCPAHDDSTSSMSVTQTDDKVLLHCHRSCTVETILAALDLTKADLFDEQPAKAEQSKIVATYDYTDEAGELLYQVVRTDPKGFRQRRPDGQGSYVWKLGDVRRVLYQLPRILQAVADDEIVYVVEGEKDVAAVGRAGGVATCNGGGAGKWRPEYSESLRGADVVVVADKDAPGYAHARAVVEALEGIAHNVWLREPAVGKDVAEHLGGGCTLDQLVDVAEEAGTDAERVEVLRPFHRIVLDLQKIPEPPSFLARWLYAACLTILQSEPGIGKSWVALWLMKQVIEAGWSVVYLDEEGGDELVKERLLALGADAAMVEERVFYYAFEGRRWDEEDLIALDEVIRQAGAVGLGVGLAVLDSLPDFLAAAERSEDSSMDVTWFVKRVCERFRTIHAAQLLLDHLVKPPADSKQKRRSRYGRGSGAKLAKSDATLLLEAKAEFDANTSGLLHLWKTKDRRGRLEVPPITKSPLELVVTVGGGSVSFEPRQPEERPEWEGPTECMNAVAELLQSRPGIWLSINQITTNLKDAGNGFRRSTVAEAAVRLTKEYADISSKPDRRGSETFCASLPTSEAF